MAQHGSQLRAIGRMLRSVGQAVDRLGLSIQGTEGYVEKLVPSTRVVSFKGKSAQHGVQAFVASSASVVGNVTLGEMSSAWYGATIRGDRNAVTIGRNTSVLDNAAIRADKSGPARIGSDVIVLPGASIASAEIGDGVMVGSGAIVQSGAKVGNDAFIDAGAVVPSGAVVPPGTLWTGSPAKQLRTLSTDEMKYLRSMAVEYGSLGQRHFEQGAKPPAVLEEEAFWDNYRLVKGLSQEDPLPTTDPDITRYYELTALPPDSGLFRGAEFNIAAERALREAEEVAADAVENEYYDRMARLRRVGETLKLLSSVRPDRPAAREKVLSDMAARDPEAVAEVRTYLERASAALGAGDEAAKAALTKEVAALDPTDYYSSDAEREAAAAEIVAALNAHGKAVGVLPPPAATSGTGASA